MRITKAQLREIIKEELEVTLINEGIMSDLVKKVTGAGMSAADTIINGAMTLMLKADEYGLALEEIVMKLANAAGIPENKHFNLVDMARERIEQKQLQKLHSLGVDIGDPKAVRAAVEQGKHQQ